MHDIQLASIVKCD